MSTTEARPLAETPPATPPRRRRRWWLRITLTIVVVLVLIVASGAIWFQVSVTPRVMLLRAIPGSDALDGGRGLAEYVPAGIDTTLDEAYGEGSDDRLDVYTPSGTTEALPTIVWVHGGGFIGGNKEGTRDYLQILASYGYTVVNVEYTKGPEAHWPTPIAQLQQAIAYVTERADTFHIDPAQIVLGGDSAGAHIVAQAAVAVTNPDYATQSGVPVVLTPEQLKGVILFSGPYDLAGIDVNDAQWGFFLKTVIWAYTGHKDAQSSPDAAFYSVTPWVTSAYPPAYISTGPADPLLPQSEKLVQTLDAQGVDVSTRFFPAETTSDDIGHEYQMNLDTDEARAGLVGMVTFLRTHVSTPTELPGVTFDTPIATPQP